jgi:GNAT superfamily N-acetyltransferase
MVSILAWESVCVTNTQPHIRPAASTDIDAIARVAVAADQVEEWSGADPAYTSHLLAHGRVVVAESGGSVTGFGATRQIGTGTRAVTMLCDLFVDPRAHGQGIGGAMLAVLWAGSSARMTFSSLHAHALPLYTRSGLDAWWPLLYLSGELAAVPEPSGWVAAPVAPGEVAAMEQEWTGVDRAADHQAWAARPAGQALVARHDGRELAAGTAGGDGDEYGLVHLALSASAGDGDARDAVLAVLAALDAPGGRARVCLPAPHPAVRPLLAAGWRNDFIDLYMATEPGLLNPRRAVPSPALA